MRRIIRKIPPKRYRIVNGNQVVYKHRKFNKQLNNVKRQINRTLKLSRNVRRTVKKYRAAKETFSKVKTRIYPERKKTTFVGSVRGAIFDAIKDNDNLAIGGISETKDKITNSKRVLNSGIYITKKTYKLAKEGGKYAGKVYRLANNLYNKAHGLGPIPDVNALKQKNKIKKTGKKNFKSNNKDGILSNAKENLIEATKTDENSVSDSFIGSFHALRDNYNKTEPVRKVAGAGYKYIIKPTARYAFDKTKQLAVNASKRYQLNKLSALRNKKQSILKSKNTAYKKKSSVYTYKYENKIKAPVKKISGIKSGVSGSSGSGKFINKGLDLIYRTKAKITNTIKLATNPIFIKGTAIALSIFMLVILINDCLAAAIAPFSIFIIDENTSVFYKTEMDRLDEEFNAKIESLKYKPGYDDHVIYYMNEDGAPQTNWKDILSIMAVMYEQDLKYTQEEINTLRNLFKATHKIVEREETYLELVPVPPDELSDDKDQPSFRYEERKRLIVEVYYFGLEDIIDGLGFTEDQKEWARNISLSDFSETFPDMPGLYDEYYTPEEIEELIKNSPNVSVKREKIIETALSLVGRVGYFWGGKSADGWNSNWGTPMLVTSPGSQTTGTYQPYGLDCSGFVDWVYKTAGVGNILSAGGTSYQWKQSYPITEGELLPGDLAFKSSPKSGANNHVGIFLGYDNAGNKLFVHCAPSTGVTVNSYPGFKYWRRPYIRLED